MHLKGDSIARFFRSVFFPQTTSPGLRGHVYEGFLFLSNIRQDIRVLKQLHKQPRLSPLGELIRFPLLRKLLKHEPQVVVLTNFLS